jgi:hypothetical protein
VEESIKYISIVIVTLIVGILLGFLYSRRQKKINSTLQNEQDSVSENLVETNKPIQSIHSDKVVFGNINNPDIEITVFRQVYGIDKYEEFKLPVNIKTGFQSLLHQAPNLASSAFQLGKNVYEVTFSPQVMAGLKNGSNTLMQSIGNQKSVAMGKNGIKELGKVVSKPGIKPAMAALAVWQVLSIVTAQKFLSDINENLKKIENNIASIKSFIENDRTHKIIANIKYLNDIANILQNKELNESDVITYNNQIEHIERECLHIQQSLNSDLESSIKKFNEVQFGIGILGPSLNESYETAAQSISEFHNYSRTIYMSIYLRTIAAQLKNSLPIDRSISEIRLNTLNEDIKELSNKNVSFERQVHNKIPTLKSKLRTEETDKEYRKNLKDMSKVTHSDLYKLNKEVENIHQSVESRIKDTLEDTSKPYKLVIETDKDKNIKSIKKLKQ